MDQLINDGALWMAPQDKQHWNMDVLDLGFDKSQAGLGASIILREI